MFDPNQNCVACEKYLSRSLGGAVSLVHASQLTQSTREAPWKLDVTLDGSARSYVMQLDTRGMEYEYRVLKAMEAVGTLRASPRAYGLDLQGEALGVPCFFSDFIAGESLLSSMIDGEPWAEALYIDTVCALHSVTESDLGDLEVDQESADEILEAAWDYFKQNPHPLAEVMYKRLRETQPDLPPVRFSNGDLWLDNFIVQDKKLSGVIDFQNAAFSDPSLSFCCPSLLSRNYRGVASRRGFAIASDMTPPS
jgi:aminoglycoside phosphotransferase (APT) family kinase protein